MRFGERLLALGLIGPEVLAEARQAQQLQGGRLGTTLVQMGVLNLDVLARALGEHLGVPVAEDVHFEDSHSSVLTRLSADLAERCAAVPLYEADAGLVVAMMDPRDPRLVTEVARAVGGPIQPCVAPELRVHYWLEKHYFIPRPNFYLRSDPGDTAPGAPERRVIVAAPAPLPGEPARLGRIAMIKRAVPGPLSAARAAEVPADDLGLDITIDARRRSAEAERALQLIERAGASSVLATALCEYLHARVECGALFQVRDQVVIGWRAAHERDAKVVATLAVPLELPTAFRAVCESAMTYRGQPPEAGRAWHRRLCELMGRAAPRDLVLVPVLAAERVLAVIYAHMEGDDAVPLQVVSDLEALAEAVAKRVSMSARTDGE
ncbi:MAG: hypothetical protein IT370_00950 [Deltaproteobacteria bacterium]|nr:hypothetical protein [Deltaproteobacteria bacterium]